jgi:S1-C subfamily serine protease
MTLLDWAIVAFALSLAVWGYQQGLIVGALTLAGFGVGAVLGGRLGPELLAGGSESAYAPLVAAVAALTLGAVAAVTLEGLGLALRARIVRGSATAAADGIGGAALIAALALGLAWVFGAVALHTPGATELRGEVQRSAILRALNELLPPSGPILNALNRVDPRPNVSGPPAAVAVPDAAIARDPEVSRAGAGVVKILGTACGLGVEGSGWVAAPGLVVTNAHVVAGSDDTTVTTRGGLELDATAVHYEPRNDLAILSTSLGLPDLAPASAPRSGAAGAVLGYPENGPFTITPARFGATQTVVSEDSYGRGPLRRRMSSFRGDVRSGNSGGPLVDDAGRVIATVFAASTSGPAGGYGVPAGVVRRALAEVDRGGVDTGPCTG